MCEMTCCTAGAGSGFDTSGVPGVHKGVERHEVGEERKCLETTVW